MAGQPVQTSLVRVCSHKQLSPTRLRCQEKSGAWRLQTIIVARSTLLLLTLQVRLPFIPIFVDIWVGNAIFVRGCHQTHDCGGIISAIGSTSSLMRVAFVTTLMLCLVPCFGWADDWGDPTPDQTERTKQKTKLYVGWNFENYKTSSYLQTDNDIIDSTKSTLNEPISRCI